MTAALEYLFLAFVFTLICAVGYQENRLNQETQAVLARQTTRTEN